MSFEPGKAEFTPEFVSVDGRVRAPVCAPACATSTKTS